MTHHPTSLNRHPNSDPGNQEFDLEQYIYPQYHCVNIEMILVKTEGEIL